MRKLAISVTNSSIMQNIDEIKRNIIQLFQIIPGEIVSDRDLGISREALDNKPDVAKVIFMNEVIDKIERYEPRVVVTDIDITYKMDNLDVKIMIEPNTEYEEGSGYDEDD